MIPNVVQISLHPIVYQKVLVIYYIKHLNSASTLQNLSNYSPFIPYSEIIYTGLQYMVGEEEAHVECKLNKN